MAAKCRAQQLSFKIGLCDQAIHYREYLKTVYNDLDLRKAESLRRALYRYEKLWLPLAADHPEECLVAPLDIEYVWHCHMLNPQAYGEDCVKTVGTTINHTLYSREEFLAKQNTSEKYWLQKYRDKSEPFTMSYEDKGVESFQSNISYDIVAAAQRRSEFFYQVSLPHYHDSKFLEDSLVRYKQFLYLKKITNETLVPTCDIDLIWCTHLINPEVYKEDMARVVGYSLNHDEIFNNFSSNLHEAEKDSGEIWKVFFHENYFIPGTMYRGQPTSANFYNTSRDDVYTFGNKSCKLTFEKLVLRLNSETHRKVKLTAFSIRDGQALNESLDLKHWLGSLKETDSITWKDGGCLGLDTNSNYGLSFQLCLWSGRLCCKSIETTRSINVIELSQFLENQQKAVTGGNIHLRVCFENASFDIHGQISPVQCEKVVLFLKRSRYHTAIIPDQIMPFIGQTAMEECQTGKSKICQIATHSLNPLFHGAYKTEITINIVQSHHLALSLIQVIYNDKLAALAQLIDSDLPLPSQVEDAEMTLDPIKGEKAVLIKSYRGDWGLLHGQWIDERGTDDETTAGDIRGSVLIKFHKCSTGETSALRLNSHSVKNNVSLESSEIDMKNGIIRLDTLKKELAENVALAFSISLLYVLCVPSPTDVLESGEDKQDKKTESTFPSGEIAFLLATDSAVGLQ